MPEIGEDTAFLLVYRLPAHRALNEVDGNLRSSALAGGIPEFNIHGISG